MPKPLPTIDPKAFAERLLLALRDFPQIPSDRGRNVALADRYSAKPPTATAWLKGDHMPSPDRVLAMAEDMNQDFMWLYFGKSVKSAPESPAAKGSHSARPDPEKLAESIHALRRVAANEHLPYDPETHPETTVYVYELACALSDAPSVTDVIDFGAKVADRLRKKAEVDNGQAKSESAGSINRGGSKGSKGR